MERRETVKRVASPFFGIVVSISVHCSVIQPSAQPHDPSHAPLDAALEPKQLVCFICLLFFFPWQEGIHSTGLM